MSVRVLVAALLAVAVVGTAAGFSAASSSATAAQTRPNVLVLMTDDQNLESVRVMANVRGLLAANGTTFANNFVSYSLCCPSRATFLTGQYAHNHGVLGNQPPIGGYNRLDSTSTLPVWLQRAGYHTVHVGKYLNGYDRTDGVPPGYDEWYGSVDPTTYRFWNYTLDENGLFVTYGTRAEDYQTDVYAQKAVDIVRRLAPSDQPFYLKVAFLAPHSGAPRTEGDPPGASAEPAPRHKDAFASVPLPQPPSLNESDVSDKPLGIRNRRLLTAAQLANIQERYQQRLESLLAVDEAIGRVVDSLQTAGELDNTLIVFTSDNGFFHGEHRVPNGKVLVYEPSIRVPLVLRGPGVPRGRTVPEAVANVDLAPTILDAANARAGRTLDGRSLLELVKRAGTRWGRDILIEVGPDPPGQLQSYSAIRTPRYLYSEYANGDRELYDLERDPFELESRHTTSSYSTIQAELARRLAQLRTCVGASCRQGPRVTLRVSCARKQTRASVAGADSRWVTRVQFTARKKRVTDRRRPFAMRVARRSAVAATITLSDGRVVTARRGC